MNNLFLIMLQCSALIAIPIGTFGIGLWLINKYIGFESRTSLIFVAFVIGFTIFVGSFLGMSIDPRATLFGIIKITKISGMIGFGAFIFVLVIVPIYTALIRILK